MFNDDDALVPFGYFAFEVGWGPRQIEKRCGSAVVRDAAGLRCIPAKLCRELITEHIALQAAARIARGEPPDGPT